MHIQPTFSAVLLDGMGTLLRLVPPVPALAASLGVPHAVAARAFRAEVAYYLEHQLDGGEPAALEDLRRRCAAVIAREAAVDPAHAYEGLMSSLRFEAFEDAAPALAELRARGLRLVVVSNWDCSLPDVLEATGLAAAVDAVVVSAAVGASKPDRRIFAAALEAAGCGPAGALHVGDSIRNDVRGAAAAGIRVVLLDRGGVSPGAITSLADLPALLS